MTRYNIGETVEVMEDPVSVQYLGIKPKWVRTTIEAAPAGVVGPDRIFVRLDGTLVTRSPQYVRPVSKEVN